MKTHGLKLFLPVILIVLPISSYATEGTCSSHHGVNCSAGGDWDGSAICNDGWRDSSERYSDMIMCKDTLKTPCTNSELKEIENKYNIDLEQSALALLKPQYDALVQSSLNPSPSESPSALQEKAIKSLEISSKMNELNSSLQLKLYQINKECQALGADTYFRNQAALYEKYYRPTSQLTTNPAENLICSIKNAHPVSTTQCACDDNYVANGSECISKLDYCQKLYGGFAFANENQCSCFPGYQMTNDGCRAQQEAPIERPKSTPSATPKPNILPPGIKKISLPPITTKPIVENLLQNATTTLTSPQASPSLQQETPKQKPKSFFEKIASPFRYFWSIFFK